MKRPLFDNFCHQIFKPSQSYGNWLQNRQRHLLPNDWDWGFLEYHRKAVENETDPERKRGNLHCLLHCEATRDFWTGSIKQINPLIQFDPEPNHELKEAKIELYKISVSFTSGGNFELNIENVHKRNAL